jgi:hypothetical protein
VPSEPAAVGVAGAEEAVPRALGAEAAAALGCTGSGTVRTRPKFVWYWCLSHWRSL